MDVKRMSVLEFEGTEEVNELVAVGFIDSYLVTKYLAPKYMCVVCSLSLERITLF